MAKRTTKFTGKGELNLAEGVLYEVKKDSVNTVRLFDELRLFDGKTVTISITEDVEIIGEEEEEEEVEEEEDYDY